MSRGFITVVGLGLLGMVTSAAAHRPGYLIRADLGSAQALAARRANPMEADMVAIVTGPSAGPATPALPAPVSAPAPPLSSAAQAVGTALTELGRPYRYGGVGPGSFDCSGLTKFAYRAAGIELPHSAAAQFHSGRRVDRSQLLPGDLIFWQGLGHVGLYIGGGMIVHAPETGDVVRISSIDQGAYLGAVRPAG